MIATSQSAFGRPIRRIGRQRIFCFQDMLESPRGTFVVADVEPRSSTYEGGGRHERAFCMVFQELIEQLAGRAGMALLPQDGCQTEKGVRAIGAFLVFKKLTILTGSVFQAACIVVTLSQQEFCV